MKERPILFSGEMVRAILDGRKTMTRRIVKPQPSEHHWTALPGYEQRVSVLATQRGLAARFSHYHSGQEDGIQWIKCPYNAGQHLWVRETRRPSIFMPRWASRITLEITGVRVERLQEITEADATAEGCEMEDGFPKEQPHSSGIGAEGWDCARDWFADLWDSINGNRAPWESNPWVFVVEFRRLP